MSLKLAASDSYQQTNAASYAGYKAFLIEEAEAFGFTPVRNGYRKDEIGFKYKDGHSQFFKNPVLVRIDYDIPALNTLELSKYNKDTKKSEKPIDKAIKLGKILNSNENCKSIISEIVGQYDTFSDFYANAADQKRLAKSLLECDILTIQEQPSFVTETGFTSQGKELIENLLAGLILSKDALIVADDRVKRFRQIIVTSLPVLSANSTLGPESLINAISEAILIEGQIRSSGLEFDTWIIQKNMFDKPPSYQALVLNRLLASGRNNFKKTISKYNEAVINNSKESLFGDNMETAEIFTKIVDAAIPEHESKIIENSTPDLAEEAIAKAEIIKEKPPIMSNPFTDGNYFVEHPDNVLAETTQSKSRYGKPITLYKGSLADVDRITADPNFVEAAEKSNPVISVINKPISKITDVDVEQIDNLENANNVSSTDQHQKSKRKAKVKTTAPAKSSSDNLETLSLSEVYNMKIDSKGTTLNSEISPDELKVFLWYKNEIGRPIRNPEWYDLAGISLGDLSEIDTTPWVEAGLLNYYNGELLPAYLYLSGDIYSKQQRLAKNELSNKVGPDADIVIEKYGQVVYNNQLKALTEIYSVKYANRLVLQGPNSETGLKVLPISKFAKNFKIETLIDEVPFKMKKITATGNKRFGTPDWFKVGVSEYNKDKFPELSLTEAFCFWLVNDKTISYKQGTDYVSIIEYYIQSKNKPPTMAVKSADGSFSPDQKAIYDKEVAAHERLKSRTKQEGDRLFSLFLFENLKLNDKVRLELQWNRDFNNIVQVNYNKIPVAFRMNKYIGGQLLDVRPEKREAVAFTTNNGSGLLAYDVGVGKTPAAIFTISQFIDMGYCSRPLVVVPNQTYKQWISEFESFCGHLKINGLYNLSDSIIEDYKEVNGDTSRITLPVCYNSYL